MIYIDAREEESLYQGVKKFLNLTDQDLKKEFEKMDSLEGDLLDNEVYDFVSKHDTDSSLEKIQMFHLTRRLNGTDITINNNLEQLLLSETPISDFFKKYKVTFKKNDGHMEMYYNGSLQFLDEDFTSGYVNMSYIKSRLGYFDIQDYCVNGFAFRANLENQFYSRLLSRCPEIVYNIGTYIKYLDKYKGDMVEDYFNNSRYYCIEYLIPLSEVIFDMGNPPETELKKTIIFLEKAIHRLYEEWKHDSCNYDENLILRLNDNAGIEKDWFVKAEEL